MRCDPSRSYEILLETYEILWKSYELLGYPIETRGYPRKSEESLEALKHPMKSFQIL